MYFYVSIQVKVKLCKLELKTQIFYLYSKIKYVLANFKLLLVLKLIVLDFISFYLTVNVN